MRTLTMLLLAGMAAATAVSCDGGDDDSADDDDSGLGDDDDDTATDDDDDDTATDDDDSTDDDDTGGADADGDGFDEAVDCDDNDAAVTPVWVSVAADEGGDGSQAAPFRTIADGVAAATGCVRVLGGIYDESVTVDAHVIIVGEGGSAAVRMDRGRTGRMFDVEAGAHLELRGMSLVDGRATEGGCIRVLGGALTATDVRFGGCSASESGGAILGDTATVSLTDVSFTGDGQAENAGFDGGGLALDESALTIDGCVLEQLVAGDYGGALYLEQCTTRISRCHITHNLAADGGAMDVYGDGTLEIVGSLLDANSTVYGGGGDVTYGGAISDTGTSLALVNCTLADNVAMRGAGIYLNSSDPGDTFELRNCIVFGHDSEALRLDGSASLSGAAVLFNDWFDNATILNDSNDTSEFDPSNLFVDPLFVDYQGNLQINDFHLDAASPLIDAGDPDAAYTEADGTRADMGCYGGPEPLP